MVTPEQLETLGYIAETYSRGWGHLTTRQNVQFHFVQLEQTPEVLRILASVGLTTREACGDTVRNVVGCHLAGACPFEVLDITPWAEATARLFLRHGFAQHSPASSRSTSPAVRPTAARPCSTTSAWSR